MKIDMDVVSDIVKEVGQKIILPLWKKLEPEQIKQKSNPSDIVTEADILAEQKLSSSFKALIPGSMIFGEEACSADPKVADALKEDEYVWIIDPVDGTLPFSKGEPSFGIMVSLVKKNVVLAGWIYHPATNDMLIAEAGAGAYFKGNRVKALPSTALSNMRGILGMDILPRLEALRQIPSAPEFDNQNYVCCGAPIALLTDLPFFDLPSRKQMHFRAVAKHCLPWDDAAGALAIREAGGELTNWAGELYRPDMFSCGIIAAPSLDDCLAIRDWLDAAFKSINNKAEH